MGPAVRALRERLLLDTLELAATKAPFYRERLRGIRVRSLDDIALLPTTSKSDLVHHGDQMRTNDEIPSVVALSSGTSVRDVAAPPAVCLRSRAEVEAFAEFREWRLSGQVASDLIVNIITAVHGAPDSAPAPGVFRLPLEKSFHLIHLRDWLTRKFSFTGFSERVHHIAGALNLIRLLAVALEATSPNTLDELELHQVLAHGDYLSARWRTTIERILRAPVVNVYGISEVAGSTCEQCPACGYFHARPIVVPEVLAPDKDDLVTQGRGELVFTALTPFQSYQPLIRYRTGDIVEIGPDCLLGDERGFNPIGRVIDRSAADIRGALELPSFLLHELFDDEPDVARLPYPRLTEFGVGPVYGAPIYRTRHGSDPSSIAIDVQLTYPQAHFPERAATLAAGWARRVQAIAGRPVHADIAFFDSSDPIELKPTGEKIA